MKKVVSIVLLLCLLFSTFIPVAYAAEENKVGGDVLADLRSMTFDGEAFKVDNFPKNTKDKSVKLLAINEVGYSASGDFKDYALYVYLYNPSGQEFVWDNSLNTIMLGVSWDSRGVAQDYENFELELVDVCDISGLENVYAMYRVKDKKLSDGKLLVERQGAERIYSVSSVELLPKGAREVETYSVGGRYVFTGYDKGYGAVASQATKTIAADQFYVEELKVHHMYFRTESSSLSTIDEPNHRNQINAVYFAIDNKILEQYDELYSAKVEWYEGMIDNIVVTDDEKFNNDMQEWLCKDLRNIGERAPYAFWKDRVWNGSYVDRDVVIGGRKQYDYWSSYNIYDSWDQNKFFGVSPEEVDDTIGFINDPIHNLEIVVLSDQVLKVGGDEVVSSEEMMTAVREAMKRYDLSDEDLKKDMQYRNRVINNEKNEDGDYAILDFKNYSSNHKDLATWMTYGFFPKIDLEEEYLNMKPLEMVTDSLFLMPIEDVMDKYYITSSVDAKNFKDFVLESQLQNKTVFILRYGYTDYNADELTVVSSDYLSYESMDSYLISGTAYAVDQALILDFDIIQLTYLKDGVKVVIPVSSAASNYIGGVTTPLDTNGTIADWWKDMMNDMNDNFQRLFSILMIVGIVIVGLLLLPVITDLIVGVIDGVSNAAGGGSHSRSRFRSRSRRK